MSGPQAVRLRTDELAYAWMDDPRTPLQIALLAVLGAAPVLRADGRPDIARVRAELAARAGRVPELGRRVRWGRRPAWVADASGPSARIGATTLPAGTDLLAWAAGRAAQPLDLDGAPWRIEVVDGLPGQRFAVLAVLHHVLADGLAAVGLMTRLFDGTPGALPRARAAPVLPEPAGAPRAGLGRLIEVLREFRRPEPAVGLPRRIGAGRHLAVVRASLDDLRRAGHAGGVTVNDLLLAAVTAGLRDLLAGRGVDPAGLVLRTTVPAATGRPGQVMGLLVVGLPVGEADPARRLALVHGATTAAKARLRAPGGDVTGLRLPGPLARRVLLAARSYGTRRVSLSVTDVPGPAAPLRLAGAPLLEAVPIAPLVQHVPLSVAALSCAGDLWIAVHADAGIPDVGVLAGGIDRSLSGLRELAGAGGPPARRP